MTSYDILGHLKSQIMIQSGSGHATGHNGVMSHSMLELQRMEWDSIVEHKLGHVVQLGQVIQAGDLGQVKKQCQAQKGQ